MAKEPESTFESYIEKERSRLTKAREAAEKKVQEVIAQIADIDRELAAIAAYEAAKAGKPITIGRTRPSSTGSRAQRGKRQEAIIEAIKKTPSGLTRGAIIEAIGVKGDKGAEQSVSNALNNMKKAGHLDNKDGKYILTRAAH